MNKLITVISFVFGSLALVATAHAQHVTNLPEGRDHAVSLEAGAESAIVARVGYHHRLRLNFWQHDLLLRGTLTLPVAELDFVDSRFEVGARTTLVAWRNLGLQFALDGVAINTSNVGFSANALGMRATLLPGYQSEHWGLMLELSYEKVFGSHIRPSDLYRQKGYAGAKSGWYGDTAGTFRVGLRGGGRLGPVELHARLGMAATEAGQPHFPPFYGTIGATYAF